MLSQEVEGALMKVEARAREELGSRERINISAKALLQFSNPIFQSR
jgi:hypothetical protein